MNFHSSHPSYMEDSADSGASWTYQRSIFHPIPVLPVYGTALASCGEIKKVCGSADSGKPGRSSHNWRSSSRSSSTRARLGALTPYCERELMGPKKASMLGNQVSGSIRSEEHTSELQSRGHL